MPIWLLGAIFSLAAGLATGLGAVVVFFFKDVKKKTKDIMLAFGAGVMLAATSFSLIIPGLEAAGEGINGASIMVAGMLIGGLFLWGADRWIPHDFFMHGKERKHFMSLRRAWLFIIAITLHNFPEGLAVGVGFGSGDLLNGLTLALGIGLQNIPEGLAVALALIANGYSRGRSFMIGLASGLVEPIGGLLGAGIVSVFQPVLPWGLAFAAGAMLFVTVGDIIPETHKHAEARMVTFAALVGFLVMLFLDVTLG
ncbi:ZIP family metal transporter [Candidatus Woesearchaeota archaeon]|nr:ZIP family metal transporter [Candidatus Woesearchaeota archaeon]